MSTVALPKTAKDITGQKFWRWTAHRYMGPGPDRRGSLWLFVCECGAERVLIAGDVRRGSTKSCGCLHTDTLREMKTTHNRSRTRADRIWRKMKCRCTLPTDPKYKDYGARGVVVCERWLQAFENFYADMGGSPPGGELERIDNDGPYNKDNCRWATRKEQCRNTRRTRFLTVGGVTKCLTEWAEDAGINPVTIRTRLKKGWTPELAVSTPGRPKKA